VGAFDEEKNRSKKSCASELTFKNVTFKKVSHSSSKVILRYWRGFSNLTRGGF
jgi:hypothetical protein